MTQSYICICLDVTLLVTLKLLKYYFSFVYLIDGFSFNKSY